MEWQLSRMKQPERTFDGNLARDDLQPEFLVDDVPDLNALNGPFDLSFDVGRFQCLGPEPRASYVSAVSRLLRLGVIEG